MQSICVCLSTSTGWFSKLIRWVTRSKVSHSFLTFRDETLDKVFVMEANGRGFMLVPWDEWKQHNQLVLRYSLRTNASAQMSSLRKLAEMLGAEYDYISLLGYALRRFVKRMRNPLAKASKLICSEAVARFLYFTNDPALAKFAEFETWLPEDILKEAAANDVFVLEEPKVDDQGSNQEHGNA